MNKEIEDFSRKLVLEKLEQVTDAQFIVFKRFYSSKNMEATKEQVAKNMNYEKIDWALTQLDNTITKNKSNNGTQFKY